MPDENAPPTPKGKKDTFRQEVDRIKSAIAGCLEESRRGDGNTQDWLMTLYKSRADRMLSDNERIWRTGSLFVPLSLSAFAALISIKHPKSLQVLILGLASFALIWCWMFIAENHRAFQQKSEAWLVAIEETIGLKNTGSDKVKGNLLNRALTRGGAVQRTRWVLAIAITAMWVWLCWRAHLNQLW